MKARIHAVCRHPAALGLGLAGLACTEATDGDSAAAAIASLAGEPAAGGLILIEQSLHDALPRPVRRQLARAGLPILMPFPGPNVDGGGPAPEAELLEILRRSIGYRLRLR